MCSAQSSTINIVHATASPLPGASVQCYRMQCVPHVFKLLRRLESKLHQTCSTANTLGVDTRARVLALDPEFESPLSRSPRAVSVIAAAAPAAIYTSSR